MDGHRQWSFVSPHDSATIDWTNASVSDLHSIVLNNVNRYSTINNNYVPYNNNGGYINYGGDKGKSIVVADNNGRNHYSQENFLHGSYNGSSGYGVSSNMGTNQEDHNDEDDDEYFSSFPPGYRFSPYDHELIEHYLIKKIKKEKVPRIRIQDVELYKYNPSDLAARYPSNEGKEWYFFTPRDRKYRNGERPSRSAGNGFWKATGADKPVKNEGVIIGFRKALVFYLGKPPKGHKTDWIMHEYKVNSTSKRVRTGEDDMRLDDWVLCRIYKKADRSSRGTPPQAIEKEGTSEAQTPEHAYSDGNDIEHLLSDPTLDQQDAANLDFSSNPSDAQFFSDMGYMSANGAFIQISHTFPSSSTPGYSPYGPYRDGIKAIGSSCDYPLPLPPLDDDLIPGTGDVGVVSDNSVYTSQGSQNQ